MITENLSTLKIHKLTQAQYNRELAAGTLDDNALYLTPDEEIDLRPYATVVQLNGKADTLHTHTIANITDIGVTANELNYLSGATSNIQAQLDNISNSTSMTLLWENASPSSNFGAQTISMDTSTYPYFLIKCITNNLNVASLTPYISWNLVKNNAENTILYSPDLIVSGAISSYGRPCHVTAEGIEFEQCICGIIQIDSSNSNITGSVSQDESGSYLIPLEIYGLKIQIIQINEEV